MSKLIKLIPMILNLFDNTNTSTQTGAGQDLSSEMKTFYDKNLIQNAEPNLIHDQFGQKKPIPKGSGKTIEFRKYSSLPKMLTPLVEGVTPTGQKLNVTKIEATVSQYGGYIEYSDVLDLVAIDDNIVQATNLLGSQAGRTSDTITREVIHGGTSVQFGEGKKLARYLLAGGDDTAANNDYLTVDCIQRAVRYLKVQNATKFEGNTYVCIIHPDAAYDIMHDENWIEAAKYAGSTQIFEGELGKISNVRFVESSEAKVFHAADLTAAARNLTVASVAGKVFTVDEAITAGEATALAGRKVIIKGVLYTIVSSAAGAAGAATITVSETVTGAPGDGEIVYPGEAGAKGRDIYSTLVLGQNAYGVTEIEGGGLQTIVKPLGSAGAADPLNQRGTIGWKLMKTAEILVDNFMVRVETASTFEGGAN